MRSSVCTSASLGTFSSSSVWGVSSEAIISGRAAFLAPEIGIVPLSGAPPVIFCRNDDRAAELAEQLAVRGFAVGGADDADADVAIAASDTTREELLEEADLRRAQDLDAAAVDLPGVAGERQARLLDARHRDAAGHARAASQHRQLEAVGPVREQLFDLHRQHS